jgi:hypothetical protein
LGYINIPGNQKPYPIFMPPKQQNPQQYTHNCSELS